MTVNHASLAEVAAHYGITVSEVDQLLAAKRQERIAGALRTLREIITGKAPSFILVVPEMAEQAVQAAQAHVLECQTAIADVVNLTGMDVTTGPSTMMHRKLRELTAALDRVRNGVAAGLVDPKQAKTIRVVRNELPDIWAAIEALGELKL